MGGQRNDRRPKPYWPRADFNLLLRENQMHVGNGTGGRGFADAPPALRYRRPSGTVCFAPNFFFMGRGMFASAAIDPLRTCAPPMEK